MRKMKPQTKQKTRNILLLLFGGALTGFANALFIVPFSIVKGGMTSVAMILSSWIFPWTNMDLTTYFLWGFNVILWFIAFFFVSKEFAISSLIGTIAYPLFYSLFSAFNLADHMGLIAYFNEGEQTSKLILFGIAGGVLNGIGLSLCFMGKGSTGGSDVLAALMVKYANFKQENASLLIDAIIVLLGFACYQDWGKALVGILTAVASSVAVKLLYGKYNTVYVLDILTDQVDEIQKIVSEELHDTCTIYTVQGGYSKKTMQVVHCVLVYREAKFLKGIIPSIDPNAFVSSYETSAVFGGSTGDAYLPKRQKEKFLRKMNKEEQKKENHEL